jgi:hypothetical protein
MTTPNFLLQKPGKPSLNMQGLLLENFKTDVKECALRGWNDCQYAQDAKANLELFESGPLPEDFVNLYREGL